MSGNGRALTRVVGAAVLDSADRPSRLLAAQRAYPPSLRGLWEFPGGKQEAGEDAAQALLRECREELGVHVRLLAEVPAPSPDGWPLAGAAVMRVFTAVLSGTVGGAAGREGPAGEALPDRVRTGGDHLQVRWMPLADPAAIAALPWIPADRPIVSALLEMLRTE